MSSFVKNTIKGSKHLQLQDIRGKILKKISPQYLENFNNLVKDQASELSYQSIVSNRNESAHGQPINMTFKKLVKQHEHAKDVLTSLSQALAI